MAKDILLRLSVDMTQAKYDFEDCTNEEEVMEELIYGLDNINQQTGNGLKVIEAKTVTAGENIDVKQTFLTYLQSQMDDFQADLKKYGKNDRIVTKKCDAMIACKEMAEAILREPVNLGINGIVTIGDMEPIKENKYDDIFVLLRDKENLVHIAPGDGTNDDSLEDGCVDYIYFNIYDLNGNEVDGGQLDIRERFEDIYFDTSDCIKDVLAFIYDTLTDEQINETMRLMKVFSHCGWIDDLPEGVIKI